MLRGFFLFLTLMGFWLILSGQIHQLRLVVIGAVSSLLVACIAVRMRIVDAEGFPVHKTLSFMRYNPWLLWKIFVANIDVARIVWNPRLPIEPRFFRISYDTRTSLGTVLYANSITLTPGTVTVQVDDGEFLVHALTEAAIRDLENGSMHRRVLTFEGSSEQ